MQRHRSSDRTKSDVIQSITNINKEHFKKNNKSQFIGFRRFQRAQVDI